MNRIYRLVWSRSASQSVPVPESAGRVPADSARLRPAALIRCIVAFTLLASSLGLASLAQAGPTGAQITTGTGSVSQTGATTTIIQSSSNLSLNWQSFNVASNEFVNFVQPSASSIAVNRILGNTGSSIFGHLSANGQVWLINPNGIVFGEGAQVNVGGLAATTLGVSDAALGSNSRTFSGSGTGSIVNQGTIRAADGGYVALLGNQVSNRGVISAQLGTIALGAGSAETLTFSGKQLIHLQVDQSTLNNLAENRQLLQADGGRVIMTAGARDTLLASVVNNTGVVQAHTVENHNGAITLLAGMAAGEVQVGGTLDASAPAGGSGGAIETSGAAAAIAPGARITAGLGGSWLIDPTDLSIDTAAATTISNSLTSGTNVTEQTTISGASGSGNQTAGPGDINVNSSITWNNAASTLTLKAFHAINVNAPVTGTGAVVMQAAGNLHVTAGESITGDAGVTLVAGANFVNNAGASAVSAGSTGRWLVYSTTPAADTAGGLTPDFHQYAATYPASTLQGTGNGFLYSVAPTITVTALTGVTSKVYDGGGGATLASSNYTVSGLINGDTVTSMSGAYLTSDVATNIPVTSPASAAALTVKNSGATIPVYGYALSAAQVTASIGTITPAPLSASIIGTPVKVYDGTTTATLLPANYQVSGFVLAQSATVHQPSSVSYGSPSAGPQTITAGFSNTNFVAGSGTTLSNYTLPTSATGPGTVLPAPLEITGVLATNKVYDTTRTDALNTAQAGLYGKIGSDNVSLVSTGAAGTFSTSHVGANLGVTVTGFTLSGAQQSDYVLVPPTTLKANITPATLTVTGVSASDKVYDGFATDPLNTGSAALSGILGSDAGTLTLSKASATGTFSSVNVGNTLSVTASGFSVSGASAPDYQLAQPTGLAANIIPAPLTITVIGNPTKIYNGTRTAVIASTNFSITGFAGSESATIPQTTLSQYASPNASVQTVTATLAPSDLAPVGSTLLSNYSIPTTATGTGTITPAPLSGAIVSNPTKVFDNTPNATLAGANYVLNGFLPGQGASVNQTSGTYASANVGVWQITATLSGANYVANSGTLLSNYALPATLLGPGTITPAIVTGHVQAGIIGNPTKTYDGTNAATLTSSNYSLTGFVAGQGATVTQTVGQYATVNAGVQPVTANLTTPDFTPNSGTNLSNYTLPATAFGTGTIAPAPLTVTIINDPTRVYNGGTSMVLQASNYSIAGLIGAEDATINPSALINYAGANVGPQRLTAALTPSAYTANAGTLLSNYVLASSATGMGHITPAPVSVTGVFATNKVYDTTNNDPLNTAAIGLAGLISADIGNVTLVGTASGAFGTVHVGNGLPVTLSGVSIGGSAAPNYTLQPLTGLTANITPALLGIAGVTANSKPYDAGSTATLNTGSASLTGILGSDSVALSTSSVTATFSTVNVGNGLKVAAAGFSISGGQSSDYSLNQPSGLIANITPAVITANIVGNPAKVYDGSPSTTLAATNYTLIGFAGSEGATVPQSATANYASPDAGVGVAINSTLVLSDFVANSGTNLSNYQLPPTGSGTGTITQAPLTAKLIGNPTKTYDSTPAASLISANYSLSGFIGSQSATVTQVSGTYAAASAGTHTVTAALAAGDYSSGSGTNLSNYVLPVSAAGPGTIARAPLSVTGTNTTSRTYDATLSDALTGATLTGTFYGSDAPVLTNFTTGTLGSSGNAGTDSVTTNFGVTGAGSSNYLVTQPTLLTAVISPAPLTAVSSVTRTYDGTTVADLSGTHTVITGYFGLQRFTVKAGVKGTFSGADVGNVTVTRGALTSSDLTATGGALFSNYSLPASDNGTGTITPATLTYTAAITNSQYGTTPSGLTGLVTGFVNNETKATATTGSDMYTTAATSASNVGQYRINGSGLTANNGNYTFVQAAGNATALHITPAPLTVINVATTDRVYDGTSVDALTGTLTGTLYNNDPYPTFTNASTAGTFSNGGNVGTTIPVTANFALSNGNYSLVQPTGLTASISAKTLTATSTVTRVYDGTMIASLSGANTVLSGFVGGQGATVNSGVTGTFASPNVGSGIGITGGPLSAGQLTANGGTLLSNYLLPTSDNGTGTITRAIVNLSGARVYDATQVADGRIFGTNGTVNTGIGSETVVLSGVGTLAGKQAGTESVSSLGSLGLSNGTGLAGNYTLLGGTDSVNVSKLGITVNGTANNKVYDGSPTATLTGAGLVSGGVLAGDTVTFADTAASFADKNAGNAKPVSISGITAGGADGTNYSINTSATTTANITPLGISVSGTGANKVYDGTVAEAVTLASSGVIKGDVVTFGAASAAFADKNAGNAKPVSISGITAGGTDAANYSVNASTTTVANIFPLGITVNGVSANKAYDGTVADVVTLTSSGVIKGDVVTFGDTSAAFVDKNVGNGKIVRLLGVTAGGTDGSNYTVNATTMTTANITPAVLTESARPTTVASGQTPALTGTVSGFVAGDTLANATSDNLVWITTAPAHPTPGTYAIDGSGLSAGNYVIAQAPGNARALTVTPALDGAPQRVPGLIGFPMSQQVIATPYGVGSDNDQGNNTGNARRDTDPTDGNRHLTDFNGRIALTVVGAGIRLPAELVQ